ncbi:MAG: flagellar hook-length control protein FliK [Propionivibrio sp.]|uniref:flagellar hook-length control protein FliK n=1 Tax=Propionivibrio sp. TaxID=2212460 RepID=UPI001A3978CA|nr:flagellar hook-length control protein FliK [Propionivibrio sp.]MBL8416356.1 flagellar hook-length control protein FliK [Propionivibrio sp.]
MIPADIASRLQISADAALRPVAPAQEIADKLSGLVAGQKVMAEIQALLPNGTYRALINQRTVTLALPFAARSGDALELQVTESNGKLALAVVTRAEGEGGKASATTSSTLSQTGQLIGTLFSGAREAKGGATALPLNANQPLAGTPPKNAQDLLPLLKQAISQSGMFYESHQAEWVEGRFTKAALLLEPQGKLSSPLAFSTASADQQASAALLKSPMSANLGEPATTPRLATDVAQTPGSSSVDGSKTGAAQSPGLTPGQLIAPQTQALVQQQLESLATQNFSWQGQIWPGQEMRWEIDEDDARRAQEGDEVVAKWSTRLHLTLPNLGEINAQIRLQGKLITLVMSAGNQETRALMRASSVALRSQLDEAGLTLASMGVDALSESKPDDQAGQ